MSQLNKEQEDALIECLLALHRGESLDECVARYPEQAEALRPILELRSRLADVDVPGPSAAAYEAGRRTLLARLSAAAPAEPSPSRRLLPALAWNAPAPFGRAIVAGLVISLLAGGALGAAAAVGGNPVSDALSALRIIENDSGGEDAHDGAIDGGETATVLPDDTVPNGSPAPADTHRPEEVPGAGLCFAEDKRAGLPEDIVEVVPDAGVCIPEALLEHPAGGAPCVPPGLAQRFEQPPVDLPVCGEEDPPPGEEAQPSHPTPPVPPMEPPSEPPRGPRFDPPHSQPDSAPPVQPSPPVDGPPSGSDPQGKPQSLPAEQALLPSAP